MSTLFRNEYRDPIRLKAHGASSFLRYENDADYRAAGFETMSALSASLAEASVSLTWQDISITEGFYEGNRPAHQSPVEFHAELFLKPVSAPRARARLGMLADFRSAYYPGEANVPDSRRAAEWEFGAHADAQLGTDGPLRLAFDARNLTDRNYRDYAYSPRSGRSYSLSLSFNL
jgi:outer membrane receptor protein involved in Fe transport